MRTARLPDDADTFPAAADPTDPGRGAAVVALLLAALSFLTLAASPLNHPDEFNYITAAREMVETGDWVTPRFNNAPRLVKPIFFYWYVASAYKAFGVHIVVARLCSAGACAAGVLAVALSAQLLLGRRAGWTAAIIAAGNVTVLQLSRFAITDPTLWAFTAFSNYGLLRLMYPPADADARWERWSSHLFFAAMALAVLTKGPVALAWCLLPLVWPLATRQWGVFGRMRWGLGLLLAIGILAPWTVLVILRNGPALRQLLIDPHSQQSYVHFSKPVSRLLEPLRIVPLALENFLVWLPLALPAIGMAIRSPWPAAQGWARRDWRVFLLCWLGALMTLFAIVEKKDFRYLFPLVLPGSILLADAVLRWRQSPDGGRELARIARVYAAVMFALAVPLVAIIVCTHDLPAWVLWPHVMIQVGAGALLLWPGRWVRANVPAIVLAAIELQSLLVPLSARALSGPGAVTLAGKVHAALGERDALLCYGISPRSLVFEARRGQIDTPSFADFLRRLPASPACLLRERDWLRVPANLRAEFIEIGRCVVQKPVTLDWLERPDLQTAQEPAVLMLRKK